MVVVVIVLKTPFLGFCGIFSCFIPSFLSIRMAFLSLYLDSIPLSPFPSNSHLLPTHFHSNRNLSGRQFVAFSTHSNPRILKSNKRLPYGKLFFPYSDEEEEEVVVREDELKGSTSEFSEVSSSWGFFCFCYISTLEVCFVELMLYDSPEWHLNLGTASS